jgi:hypothetical protein
MLSNQFVTDRSTEQIYVLTGPRENYDFLENSYRYCDQPQKFKLSNIADFCGPWFEYLIWQNVAFFSIWLIFLNMFEDTWYLKHATPQEEKCAVFSAISATWERRFPYALKAKCNDCAMLQQPNGSAHSKIVWAQFPCDTKFLCFRIETYLANVSG